MRSPLIRLAVILVITLFLPSYGNTQEFNLKYDLRGKPILPNVIVNLPKGAANIPWECEKYFEAILINTISDLPGVGKTFTKRYLFRYENAPANKPWLRNYLSSRHIMINSTLEGGDIIKDEQGKELLRYLSFQIDVVNIATSQVVKSFRIYCDSAPFLERAKIFKKTMNPKIDVFLWAINKEIEKQYREQIIPVFYNIDPVAELNFKGKDKGLYTNWSGKRAKDVHKRVDIVGLVSTTSTRMGDFHEFVFLGTGTYSRKNTRKGQPYYKFISGKSKIQKASEAGIALYAYPDFSKL